MKTEDGYEIDILARDHDGCDSAVAAWGHPVVGGNLRIDAVGMSAPVSMICHPTILSDYDDNGEALPFCGP